MKIEDALLLMARNPAVDFPWEEALIGLVNNFLHVDVQLDPRTASAMEIKVALSTLDAETQQMVLLTSVGGQFTGAPPMPVPESGKKTDTASRQFNTFMIFGVAVCVIGVILAFNIGAGVNNDAVVEITKLIVELAKLASPVPAQ